MRFSALRISVSAVAFAATPATEAGTQLRAGLFAIQCKAHELIDDILARRNAKAEPPSVIDALRVSHEAWSSISPRGNQ